MRIGIDITTLAYQGFGVTNYTYNFIKNLLMIDKTNEYHLFYSSFHKSKNSPYLDEFKKLGAKIHEYRIPLLIFQILWGKLDIFPVEWLIGKVDVFFSSDFLRPPLLKGTRGVTTVHDLVWKIYPQFHEDWIVAAHVKKLEKTIKFKDAVIADSRSTKNDLQKYYPEIISKNIHVVYPGIGKEFKPLDNKEKINNVLKKYKVNYLKKFLLYVGAIEPRKNLVKSIEAFSELIKDREFSDYEFIIAGGAGWKNKEVFNTIGRLKLDKKVRFIGFVDDEDLPYLYNAAQLTVYLSTYEGFGLPPLESLACGTKTIVGNNSSLKETIDEKYLIDVTDQKKVLEKIKFLLKNKVEINSREIKEKFSWINSAKEFLKIIDLK